MNKTAIERELEFWEWEAQQEAEPFFGVWSQEMEREFELWDWETEQEMKPFHDVCSQYDLPRRFTDEERKILWIAFLAAQAVRFLVSSPLRHEDQITREEAHFVELRRGLFSTQGWKRLPAQIREDIEQRLLQGWEDPWLDSNI